MSKGPEIDAAAARKVADACSEFKLPKASEVSATEPARRDWRQRRWLAACLPGAVSMHAAVAAHLPRSSFNDRN